MLNAEQTESAVLIDNPIFSRASEAQVQQAYEAEGYQKLDKPILIIEALCRGDVEIIDRDLFGEQTITYAVTEIIQVVGARDEIGIHMETYQLYDYRDNGTGKIKVPVQGEGIESSFYMVKIERRPLEQSLHLDYL